MGREVIIRSRAALVGAVLLVSAFAFGGDVQTFRVSQADVRMPDVNVYVDVLDRTEAPATDVNAAQFAATLGSRSLQPVSADPLQRTGEGVAYVFVVDTSESIQPQHFEQMRASLQDWTRSLGPKDRVALVSFAEKVQTVADFTDARDRVVQLIAGVKRTGKRSLLHQALLQGIELGKRRDAGLPSRRVMVVLSDGKDEGSALAVEDVLAQARSVHVPIYAIGYSTLPGHERRQYLDVLRRFALLSGGVYEEPALDALPQAFTSIRKAATRVWNVKFRCAGCAADGQKYRLEVKLNAAGRSFTDGFDVNVLPPEPPARPAPTAPKKMRWWIWALVAVGVAGAAYAVSRAVRKPKTPVHPAQAPAPEINRTEAPAPTMAAAAVAPRGTAVPTAVLKLRFTTVRGRTKGEVAEATMRIPAAGASVPAGENIGRITIGRQRSCDLALTDDATVSGQHCVVAWVRDRLVIRDLQSSNGTYVNGVPVRGDQPLESGDVVGIGQTEFRITAESERA